MTDKIKDRLWREARCAEDVMRYLWRAYFAAKYDNAENCIGILRALLDTTADERVFKLIQEVIMEQSMDEIKTGEKYYLEVEVDSEHDANSVYVVHPDHPGNEYSGICVYKKDLISK